METTGTGISPYVLPGIKSKADVIIDLVCTEFKVPRQELVSSSHKRKYAEPKQAAAYLLKIYISDYWLKHGRNLKNNPLTHQAIADLLGYKNRASVRCAFTTMDDYMETYQPKKRMRKIEEKVKKLLKYEIRETGNPQRQ